MEDQNKNSFHRNESYQPTTHQPPLKPTTPEKKKHFAKADAWLKKHPRKSLALLVAFLFIFGGGIIFALGGGSFDVVTTPAKSTAPTRFYSSLTGKEVSEVDSKRAVTAVMVENSPEARPQSGLKEANLVFESVAEGGITRFLLFYQEGKPKLIGPVRSVRPQFASLLAPFNAGLAHVGGSDIPLKKLRSGKIRDLDQFFNAGAYWLTSDRFAPHNTYTSTEKLDALNKAKNYNSSDFDAWAHNKKAVAVKTPNATTIKVPISVGLFSTSYKWNKAKNTYTRSQGGAPHTDREKGPITPKVVIAMQVPHDVIRDSNGYSYPDINKKGSAWMFQNGTVKKIKWSKSGDKSMIKWTDSEGKTVKLNPGQTWVALIKPGTKPTWK
jgi:hypothetical protein